MCACVCADFCDGDVDSLAYLSKESKPEHGLAIYIRREAWVLDGSSSFFFLFPSSRSPTGTLSPDGPLPEALSEFPA